MKTLDKPLTEILTEPSITDDTLAHTPELREHVTEGALGSEAVKAAIENTHSIINGSEPDNAARSLVGSARARVRNVPKHNRKYMPSFFSAKDMPSSLQYMTGSEEDPKSLTDKFAEGKLPYGVALNVLEWRNWRHTQRQREFEEQELPEYRVHYKEAMERAVDAGWIPDFVLPRLSRIDTTPTFLDDGFDTELGDTGGYSDFRDMKIVLGPHYNQHIYVHEATHLMSMEQRREPTGKTESVPNDGLKAVFLPKNKVSLKVAERVWHKSGSVAIDEATIEHIALSLEDQDFERIVTENGVPKEGSYETERMLLNTLCTQGVQPVDVKLFIAAYFESETQMKELGEESASARLVRELQKAFPRTDVMYNLSHIVNKDNGRAIKRLIRKLQKDGKQGPVPKFGYKAKTRRLGEY